MEMWLIVGLVVVVLAAFAWKQGWLDKFVGK